MTSVVATPGGMCAAAPHSREPRYDKGWGQVVRKRTFSAKFFYRSGGPIAHPIVGN
ncbi:hypothetical protein CBM2585_A160337 [Cupriavidus taiwanensis]|nr:hypothetical protein CBM2585_A160337 [Cupriavidus taiwanensis]